MTEQNLSESKEQILDLLAKSYQEFGALVEIYPWAREEDRWHELVFCLLCRIGQPVLSALTARKATLMLRDLGLLDVNALARVASIDGQPDYKDQQLDQIIIVLQRLGFNNQQAKIAAAAIYDLTKSLAENYDGRIQKYLRKYGQLMIDELSENFAFSNLEARDARYVFTHWLQQVLNMPLALSDPSVELLCKQFNVKVEELISAVDDQNLNLALLDEFAIKIMAEAEVQTK